MYHNRLRDMGHRVIKLAASHEGLKAEEASTEEAGNLQAVLDVSIGCRIMLTENLSFHLSRGGEVYG